MEMLSETQKEKDRCVLCRKETEYYKDTHINFRERYVEGSGQLCPGCYRQVYDTSLKV